MDLVEDDVGAIDLDVVAGVVDGDELCRRSERHPVCLASVPHSDLPAPERDRERAFLAIPMQDDLTTLSTNSVHRYLPNATHATVGEDEDRYRPPPLVSPDQ